MSSRYLRLRLLRFVLSVSTYSELTFSSVAAVRDAIAAFSFAGTVHHSGDVLPLSHNNDFFDGSHGDMCSKTARQVG